MNASRVRVWRIFWHSQLRIKKKHMLKAYICNVKTTSPTMFALLKVVYLCLTCLYVFKWRVVFSSPDTYARLCIHIHIMQYLDNTWTNFKSKKAYITASLYVYKYMNNIFPGTLLYFSLSLVDLFYRCSTVTKAFPNATCMCVVCKTHWGKN